MAAMTDILEEFRNVLDINTNDSKMKAKAIFWANTIYRNVVNLEEFSWRRKPVALLTVAPVTVAHVYLQEGSTIVLAYGDTDYSPYVVSNFLVVEGEKLPYQIVGTFTSVGGVTLTLAQNYLSATGEKSATLYFPRYELTDIKEDWITGVYLHDHEETLDRIYPSSHLAYLHYSLQNPTVPRFFYTQGVSSAGNALLCLSPCPDAAYQLTVETLLKPERLTEESTSTILPDDFESDVLTYGVGMLYSLAVKDKEGMELYQLAFSNVVKDLLKRQRKDPGLVKRLLGYTLRDAKLKDPDIPYEWNF